MKKRIMVLSHGLSNGGSQRVASLIANHMSCVGHEVIFVAAHSPTRTYPLNDEIEFCYIGERVGNKLLNFFARCFRIFNLVRRKKIDVAIVFIYEEGIALLPFRKLKKIYTMRNAPVYFGKTQFKLMRMLYRNASNVVFQTNDAMECFDEKTKKHSVVIPNPISSNLPSWIEHEHKKEIVCVCRLDNQKNLPMLIDAFEIVHKEYPEYTLTIYGKGPLENKIKDYVKNKGLMDSFSMPGYSDNVHIKMAEASVFALSSDYEGISNSMIEAMGIGVPCICTDCPIGGARMIIDNNVNGILVPVGDTEAMANAISKVISDEEFAKELSKNSIKIRDTLNQKNICDKWAKLVKDDFDEI